jgi:hypothetical protein
LVISLATACVAPAIARAEPAVLLDRVVVRWSAPETGGVTHPQLVYERELAFEARLEALAAKDQEPSGFGERHVRAALDRHIAETLLASLPVVPEPSPKEIAARADAARRILEQRVGGRPRLLAAAQAEGLGSEELDTILRRQAKASLYLDRMIAPMLEPTEDELREALRSGATPFGHQPLEKIAEPLERWLVAERVTRALEQYYETARARVKMVLVRAPR